MQAPAAHPKGDAGRYDQRHVRPVDGTVLRAAEAEVEKANSHAKPNNRVPGRDEPPAEVTVLVTGYRFRLTGSLIGWEPS